MGNESKEVYFVKNGLYVRTSHMIQGDAFIIVETAVRNSAPYDAEVWIDIHMHRLVDTGALQMEEEPGIQAAGDVKLFIPAGTSRTAKTQVCVENAAKWQMDDPALYVVEAVLYKPVGEGEALPNPKLLAGLAMRTPHAMKMIDFEETRFGIRDMTLDAKNGFCLNGTKLKLKGSCLAPLQGSADSDKETVFLQEYDRVKRYKADGNNVADACGGRMPEEFFDACNRLGVLVIDEVAHESEILRQRNFPSVVGWMSSEMEAGEIRALDQTRFVGVMCDASFGTEGDAPFDRRMWNDTTEVVCADWDFVGYPCENTSFKEAHAYFPNRCILSVGGSEAEIGEDVKKYGFVIGALNV
jgi:beta-galactosidase